MIRAIGIGLLCGLGIYLFLKIVIAMEPQDDTDPPGGRSGMRPMIDFKTGCQYLTVPGGGITQRVGPDGRQMGCKE